MVRLNVFLSFIGKFRFVRNRTSCRDIKFYILYDLNDDDSYLNMKINNIRSEKNTATLSIVRSMTNNCLRRFGMNRTSFNIRKSLNVLRTLKPELPALSFPLPSRNVWHNSMMLKS